MADRKIADLTELTAPAADDVLPIIDTSEATNAAKNKKIQYSTLLRRLPDGSVGAPSIGWLSDLGVTGIYRTAANELAFSNNSTFTGKFTTAGFQLGSGTAAAQLHLFSSDTTDQVIIENTDAGLDTAPDVVLYRNSASPAANDNLGNLEYRGKDSAGNTHAYAQITGGIKVATNGTEDGILDLMSSAAGTTASRVRLFGSNVGIGEAAPSYPLHITYSAAAGTALQVESKLVDAASAGDITLYHHRNGAAGQDNDEISTVYFRSNKDAGTPVAVDYAAIQASIVDASSTTEDGKLELQVQAAGTLTTEVAITAANVTLGSRPIIPTHTPSSATDTGTAGEIAWDADYIYICTATDTWKRVAISTWP